MINKCEKINEDDTIVITREANGRFKKGTHAWPKGKPRGQYTEAKKRFIEVKEMAARYGADAFDLLWKAMKANEPWAFHIYFKELYSIPKNYGQKTVIIEKEERSIDGQIKVLTEVLPEFDELTQTESLERLKVLNSLKPSNTNVSMDVEVKDSKEDLREKIDMIQTILDYEGKKIN